jgi:hypothetical protein
MHLKLHATPLFPAQQTVPTISLVVMLGHMGNGASVCAARSNPCSVLCFAEFCLFIALACRLQRGVRSAGPALSQRAPTKHKPDVLAPRLFSRPFSLPKTTAKSSAHLSALRAADQRIFANHGWNLDAEAIPDLPSRARP